MREYTELYPTVCIGQILAYPLYGGPQDCRQRAFDILSGNQSRRLVSWVRRVQKGHTVTHILVCFLPLLWIEHAHASCEDHVRVKLHCSTVGVQIAVLR